jgi:heterotetrameric sarcosine oxidase delta subunit
MYSARGVMMLSHNIHDQQVFKRHIHANRLNGIDNEWLTPEQAQGILPAARYFRQRPLSDQRCGAAAPRRHGPSRCRCLGLCPCGRRSWRPHHPELRSHRHPPRAGRFASPASIPIAAINAKKVGVVAAGHTSVHHEMAGVRMPLVSYPLQALVSEPLKPIFPCVVMSNTVHAYISQSDKGELVIGAGTDQYSSYSQTGGLQIITHTLDAICELFPMFRRIKMMRSWGGIVDNTPDRSPILAKTPVPGLYVNCGWGTGGFKATPGSANVFAHTDRPRRAAQDQRAVHAGALPLRPPDRRSRGRRRRALTGGHIMLLIYCPYCEEERSELEFRKRRRRAYRPPDQHRGRDDRRGLRGVLLSARQPQGLIFERWRHLHGCGRFFNAARDTVSDKFLTTYKAGLPKPDLGTLRPAHAQPPSKPMKPRKGREMSGANRIPGRAA